MDNINHRTGIAGAVESCIGGRKENQDSYGFADTPLGMLVTVCDGMGGGPGGKTASTLAVDAILNCFVNADPSESPEFLLRQSAWKANEAILSAVESDSGLKGMGTTSVTILIKGAKAYIMHVGDSRCYQLRAGKAVYRSADHSYVGELVRRGTISEEEARTSKYSNVITRAIGTSPDLEPEIDVVNTKAGDRFALMTDGIWGAMPENQLVVLLCSNEPPEELVSDLAERVEEIGVGNGGGHDNLTLAVIDLPGNKQKKKFFHNSNPDELPAKKEYVAIPVHTEPQSVNPGNIPDNIEEGENSKSVETDSAPNSIVEPQKSTPEIRGTDKPASRKSSVRKWVIAAVCIVLLASIGINVWLMVRDDEKTVPDPSVELAPIFGTDGENNGNHEETDDANIVDNANALNPETYKENPQNRRDSRINERTKPGTDNQVLDEISKIVNESGTKEKENLTDNKDKNELTEEPKKESKVSPGRQKAMDAAKLLDDLQGYYLKDYSDKNKSNVIKQRNKYLENSIRNLKDASKYYKPKSKTKADINKIIKELNDNRQVIIKIDDNGKTTQNGVELLKGFKMAISKIDFED